MKRRALVTGVTGFIGGRLAQRLLEDGWDVHAIVRPGSDRNALPFADRLTFHMAEDTASTIIAMEQARPDLVYHLASLYLADHQPGDLDHLIASNILFTTRIAEAMSATLSPRSARLVSTGTAWQHFRGPDYVPVNLYAATKQASEDILRYYVDAHGLSLVVLKLFDTFGAGDTRRKLVQLMVDAAVSGQRLGISPGEQIIDISHVDDVVDAFLVAGRRLLDGGALKESWFVSGERHKVRDLADIVGRALGRYPDVALGERPYRPREVMTPIAPAPDQILPDWRPRRRLARMLPTLAG